MDKKSICGLVGFNPLTPDETARVAPLLEAYKNTVFTQGWLTKYGEVTLVSTSETGEIPLESCAIVVTDDMLPDLFETHKSVCNSYIENAKIAGNNQGLVLDFRRWSEALAENTVLGMQQFLPIGGSMPASVREHIRKSAEDALWDWAEEKIAPVFEGMGSIFYACLGHPYHMGSATRIWYVVASFSVPEFGDRFRDKFVAPEPFTSFHDARSVVTERNIELEVKRNES